MPRAILSGPQTHTKVLPGARPARTGALTGARLQQRLRERRSGAYVQAVAQLDAGGHVSDREALERLLAAIAEEFPELSVDQRPMGIVARCHLGAPYEVHTCDPAGDILQHFKLGQALPGALERGRRLALHPAYAFIEVYPDSLHAVAGDGTVSVVQA